MKTLHFALGMGGKERLNTGQSPLASVTVRGTCLGTCHVQWMRGWGFPPAWGNEEVIIVAPFTRRGAGPGVVVRD